LLFAKMIFWPFRWFRSVQTRPREN